MNDLTHPQDCWQERTQQVQSLRADLAFHAQALRTRLPRRFDEATQVGRTFRRNDVLHTVRAMRVIKANIAAWGIEV